MEDLVHWTAVDRKVALRIFDLMKAARRDPSGPLPLLNSPSCETTLVPEFIRVQNTDTNYAERLAGWDEAFAKSPELLEKLAAEALAEDDAGETELLIPEEL